LDATEVGLHQGTAGEEERHVGRLTSLNEEVFTRLDIVERVLPRSIEAGDLAHAREDPTLRHLVTAFERLSSPVLVTGERAREIVDEAEHVGQVQARPRDQRTSLGPRLEHTRLLDEHPRVSAPEEQVAKCLYRESSGKKTAVAGALGQVGSGSSVVADLADGGLEQLRGNREADLALCPQHVVCAFFVERLPIRVGARAPIETVQIGVGEPPEHIGAFGPGRTDGDLLEDVAGTGRIHSQDPILGLCPSAPTNGFHIVGRSESTGSLAKLSGSMGRPARKRPPRALLERASGFFVETFDSDGEMTRTLLRIAHERRQSAMELAPTIGRRLRIGSEREQRMSERDPLSVALGDVGLEVSSAEAV
jgi:hypothetical protein